MIKRIIENKQTLILCVIFFLLVIKSYSQISVSNLLQYQLGNQPTEQPSDRTALYNQLNMQFYYQNIHIGGRIEYFHLADREQEYAKFQQKYIHYQKDNLEIKFGNFYESFGQGLLLRTYEIPGLIYEETGSRQQYGFYKDLEGALLKFYSDWFSLKVLYGYPLDLLQPPGRTQETRRPTLVQGGEINFTFLDYFSPGLIYLRSNDQNNQNEYAGLNLNGNIELGLQYYFEYVQDTRNQNEYFSIGSTGRHATYGSISQTFDWASFSVEIKDYHDFTLNFNDPPNLVREHARTLLNRGIHAIQTLDERGFQIEGIFNIGNLNTLTANHAYAENKFSGVKNIFREYYMDVNYYLIEKTLSKIFIDWMEDELVNINNRWSGGILIDQHFFGPWSGIFDVQAQRFSRNYPSNLVFNHSVYNYFFDLAFSHSPNISFGINVEAAHDPLESDTLFELENTDYKYWVGTTFNYRYDQNHTVAIFYGKRRGGNACSGGICYEVPPFQGFELRLNSIL